MEEKTSPLPADLAHQYEKYGFCVVANAVTPGLLGRLQEEVAALPQHNRAGVRDLFRVLPSLKSFVRDPSVRELVDPLLTPGAAAVRAILFDKSFAQNWSVDWHQDTTIAVAERLEAEGFASWSVKAGATHVSPPEAVLRRMATLRVHLDAADSESGALQVIPGSQQLGKLTSEAVSTLSKRNAVLCPVAAGGVMAMSPLLVHKSAKLRAGISRRVLHIEFADAPLPAGMRWRDAH